MARAFRALFRRAPVLAPPRVAQERLTLCRLQDGDCYDAWSRQCKVCSCFVAVKTALATEECPRGLWKRHIFRSGGGRGAEKSPN